MKNLIKIINSVKKEQATIGIELIHSHWPENDPKDVGAKYFEFELDQDCDMEASENGILITEQVVVDVDTQKKMAIMQFIPFHNIAMVNEV